MASEGDSDAEEKKPLSKKKARKMNRLTVAELKQLVKKPEVVEWTDVTASDPRLLPNRCCEWYHRRRLYQQHVSIPFPIPFDYTC